MAVRTTPRKRLPPEIFDLPVEKMREGYYTDAYFNYARDTLLADDRRPRVVMQVFQRKHAVLGGIDEAIAILKLCSEDWNSLIVHALYDGDRIEPWETVMTIEGPYDAFAHLETLYLGVLARRTLITTNVVGVLEAARGKPVIFMPARHDHCACRGHRWTRDIPSRYSRAAWLAAAASAGLIATGPTALGGGALVAEQPAVARAAMESGVARKPIVDMDAYRQALRNRRDPVAGVSDGRAVRRSVAAGPDGNAGWTAPAGCTALPGPPG
jgi:nicotinate phosphoribosyltransferase